MSGDPNEPKKAQDNEHPAEPARHRREGIGLMGRLRAYFLAGILVTAPIAITAYIAWWFVSLIDGHIRPLIPSAYNPDNYLPFSIPGIGVLVVIVVVTLIGAFAAGYVGRLVLGVSEGVVGRMPVVRSVYGAVKQIFETVLAKKSNAFREVVMIQYPRPGVWSLGFITGSAHPEVQLQLAGQGEDIVNVFIPCAPPTAGYLAMVPRREVTALNMSVEDGLKLVMSGGIVVPPDRRPTLVGRPADHDRDEDDDRNQPDRKVLAAASRSKR
ncbi:DUF502 domain-containing protein [Azospirillum ramasamyi]|uniref:DUF502 domain-containing protein n=1 Tax=Azospirillum ramasamyi TaxID=682998 RepID=A0A2U9S3K2_9PROT|nr:DUF502 domain-containing protein [Azospirillum ramasamyi]AWU93932.1 DUF502 domain-containing protein [Azospirillum ramasamyi]